MKHPSSIQISIPQPCSEDWNKMTPQQQGRFCDSCQKCVVDFTNFSDKELYQYLAENAGKNTCGRFRAAQLNRPIQLPFQPHSQLYKWIVAAGLSLVFTIASDSYAFAQAPMKHQKATIENTNSQPGADNTSEKHKPSNTIMLEEFTIIEYKEPLISGAWTLHPGTINESENNTITTGGINIEEMQVKSQTAVESVLKRVQPTLYIIDGMIMPDVEKNGHPFKDDIQIRNNTPANRSNKEGEK